MLAGTWMAVSRGFSPVFSVAVGAHAVPGYAAFYALLVNLAVAVVLTVLCDAAKVARRGSPQVGLPNEAVYAQ
jgi:SSS family solute:Na+ symporter